jgi:hypothetical protein
MSALVTKYLDNKIIFNEEQINYLINKEKYFLVPLLLEYNHGLTVDQFNKIKSHIYIPEIFILRFGFETLVDHTVALMHIIYLDFYNDFYNDYNIVLTTDILDEILCVMIEQYASGYTENVDEDKYIKFLALISKKNNNIEPPLDDTRLDYHYVDELYSRKYMVNFVETCKNLFPERYSKYFNKKN